MSETVNQDLLKTGFTFKLLNNEKTNGNIQIIEQVCQGKITKINDHFLQMMKSIEKHQSEDNKRNQIIKVKEEIKQICNVVDTEGKTPLFYACFYNFQNLVIYLLDKGADPYIATANGQNVFHLCCFMGHVECLSQILNFQRHKDRMELLEVIKENMKTYQFKRTDVREGVLVSPDKHNPLVQKRFKNFREAMKEIFKNFLTQILGRLSNGIQPVDSLQRNPLHYSSLNKFTKCHKSARYLIEYGLELQGYQEFELWFNQVSLLELNKEIRIDPKQYLFSVSMAQNFLLPQEYKELISNFQRQMKQLIQQTINAQDNDGYSSLHYASFYGDFQSVQFFLKHGGDPKAIDTKNKKEVLDYASGDQVRKYLIDLKDATRKGDGKSFNFLVNCGHSVNGKKTIFGIAPIHNAIQSVSASKNDAILKEVVKCNADINIQDSNGWTSLHHACKNGDLSTVQYLILEKADITKSSTKGYQPIHVAAIHNRPQVIEFLIENKANIEALTVQKLTPLHLAAKNGNVESMKVLLDKKANIYAIEERNWTALHFAAFYYHKDAVQLLQRYDSDYEKLKNMVNSQGKIAKQIVTNEETRFALYTLWNASREGNLDYVRRLITLGQNINEQTIYNKTTPLMFATQNQHYLIVKCLLENKADKAITDKSGKTALNYAYDVNNRKIIGLLDDSINYQLQEQEIAKKTV